MQTRVLGVTGCSMFGIGRGGVVALAGDFPTHAVPHLVQILQWRTENFFGIAPNTHLTHTALHFRMRGTGFANHMAVLGQAVLPQHLHHAVAFRAPYLNHHAQLFIEQGLQTAFVSAH